ARTAPAGAPPASTAAAGTDASVLPAPASIASTAGAPTAPADAPAVAAQTVTITTDLVRATIDSRGGSLVRVELLKQVDSNDARRHVVLLDRSAERFYVAQTGLIPAQGGNALPNHLTVMNVVPGEHELKDGANELRVRLESPEVDGIRLVK